MRKLSILILTLLFIRCTDNVSVQPSDLLREVPVMAINMTHDDLLTLRANRTTNTEVAVKINWDTKVFDGTIRASGAGSRYHPKWSYRVSLANGQYIDGLNEFNLSAQVFDPTMMYTNLALNIFRQLSIPAFRSRHVFLKINNEESGLYPMIELVDEPFLLSRKIKYYEMYKVAFGAKFTYTKNVFLPRNFDKRIPDDDDYGSLSQFINAIDTSKNENIPSYLAKFLDIEGYIKYHAATTLMNNVDALENNFYLYSQKPGGEFRIIPWDFDGAFNRSKTAGLAGDNDIIRKLFKNDVTFQQYKDELIFQAENIFTEENLYPVIDSVYSVIMEAYNLDPYLGDGRYNLDGEIENLKQYIANRRQYILNNINSLNSDYFELP
jgi:spore coat protein H